MMISSFTAHPLLSRTADYGLRAVLALGNQSDGRLVTAEELAARTGAPRNYLSKTLHTLAKEGIVKGTRGPNGGFALNVPATELTVARVIEALAETRRREPRCLLGSGPCNPSRPCAAHQCWTTIAAAAREPLAVTTVADLLGERHIVMS